MFIELLQNRRSIRKYADRPVETEKVRQLVEAALRAPASMTSNPWQFVVVDDTALLERLSRAKQHGSGFLSAAPLGIVVCADPARSTVWIEDAAIATTLLHLAAASMELGSCWIQLRGRMHSDDRPSGDYAAEVLGLPSDLEVEAIVAIGYPAEKKSPHPQSALQYEKVHHNAFGQTFQTK